MSTALNSSRAASAALDLARRGWPVFPCRRDSKTPLTRNGFKDATLNPDEIGGLFQTLDPNVAVRTGAVSGIVVLDVDGDDGFESLHRLAREHGPLPRTASVKTPRGGQHFYFAHPGGTVPCSVGNLGPGLDVRGDGGYVLVPPSVVNGRAYVVDDEAPIAPLPGWLLERITHTRPRGNGQARDATHWRDLAANGVSEGARNDSCARLAGHLLARGVDPFVCLELVVAWDGQRNQPPLGADEAAQVVRSIARREAERWK